MQDSPLNFNPEFLFKKSATELFITPETQEKTSEKCLNAISEVNASVEEGAYPFINVLKEQSYIEHTGAVFENIRWAQTMIVVGIGGSNLGALALKGIFEIQEAPMRVLFHGDSPDPVALDRLLEKISLEKTVFVIISKSGQTVETMVQYLYLKTLYQDNESWQKHFIFITDPVEGLLRLEATSHGISTLEIPSGVGGRFSVLTPVGFLPALAMGIAIEELRQGALDCIESENLKEIVAQFATTQFQLYEEGCKVVSCMPYATQLEEFSKWFRQLWAESLGKNGGGILPVTALGPVDQHSQLQFYNEGTKMLSVLFLTVKNLQSDRIISEVSIPAISYLQNQSFGNILKIEYQSTALSLYNHDSPSATLQIDSLTPRTVGTLFLFFELAVVYLAKMLSVNAFDQPGVEESKQLIFKALGRV